MRPTYALWLWDWNRWGSFGTQTACAIMFLYSENYIHWLCSTIFLGFPKKLSISDFKTYEFWSLAQMEWRVNRSNIAIYMTDICIHSKLWLQMWLSVTWNVKGSIDCSVLFCNVTLVLTLSVTLDTWCIMSVAETRKMVTENIRGLFVANNIRPLNP